MIIYSAGDFSLQVLNHDLSLQVSLYTDEIPHEFFSGLNRLICFSLSSREWCSSPFVIYWSFTCSCISLLYWEAQNFNFCHFSHGHLSHPAISQVMPTVLHVKVNFGKAYNLLGVILPHLVPFSTTMYPKHLYKPDN